MITLSWQEAEAMLTSWKVVERDRPEAIKLKLPRDFGPLYFRASDLVTALGPFSQVLVTIHPIFPPGIDAQPFDRFRLSYGERRSIQEVSGHLCQAYEIPEITSLLYFAMLLQADARATSNDGYGEVFISHDGYVRVHPSDPEMAWPDWKPWTTLGPGVGS